MGKSIGKPSKKLIFIDRDGVILEEVVRSDGTFGSIRSHTEFKYMPFAQEFSRFCSEQGFITVLTSNQPDVGRNFISSDFVYQINKTLIDELKLNFAFWCPHSEIDQCLCRKPKTGMFEELISYFGDREQTFFIGDRLTDIEVSIKLRINGVHLVTDSTLGCSCRATFHIRRLEELISFLGN